MKKRNFCVLGDIYIIDNNHPKQKYMNYNSKDLSNLKFGKLLAIHSVEKPITVKSKSRSTWWLCQCECGQTKIVRSTELIKGDTKSCGCGNRYENSCHYRGIGKLAQSKFSHIKYNAIKRNLDFDISIEDAWNLFLEQDGKCYYTKKELILKTRNSGSMTASLDRIDSSKGYVKGNIVWVHKDVNIMKNEYSHDYFLSLCKLIVENHCPYEPRHQRGNQQVRKNSSKNDEKNLDI